MNLYLIWNFFNRFPRLNSNATRAIFSTIIKLKIMELWLTNKYTSFLSTNTHLVFPPQPFCLFRELIYACKDGFKCMVKLDIVSVEILTNSICFPLTYVFQKNICAYFRTCCFRKPLTKYMFLKIEKIHVKHLSRTLLFIKS